LKGDKDMDYRAMRDRIEDMVNDNHGDFVKAIISIEKGINDESVLDKLYDAYMDNDSLNLLNDEFDNMHEELRDQDNMNKIFI
jgi:putative single-strand binding protein